MSAVTTPLRIPEIGIDVVESGRRSREGRACLDLERDVNFSTARLVSYAFARWEPVVFDAMVVAASIEYGDRIVMRPRCGWARRIALRIPVDDPVQWSAPAVADALKDATEFLTGDYWIFEFVRRASAAPSPPQDHLNLPVGTRAVLAYSDGMDSRAVAAIVGQNLGDKFLRVRVGSKSWDRPRIKKGEPFTTVPYDVKCNMPHREATSRSRGFKFAMISGIAAYLADATEIIIPESGQGAIGPALVNAGHAYPDYRNHPLFARRMERFLNSLLRTRLKFAFPRIWNTKGQTLREYLSLSGSSDWVTTRSCWRNNQWSSVNGKLRQCGVCAACMLRRVSVHAAGLTEDPEVYVTTNMEADSLENAISKGFTRLTPAFKEYAIAGVLHLDHLADLAELDALPVIRRHAGLLAPALGLSREECEIRIRTLFQTHAEEWKDYLASLGVQSFANRWVRADR
jgi:7-cyano-7-deazaguanine synthase in queuosine biosynthesis